MKKRWILFLIVIICIIALLFYMYNSGQIKIIAGGEKINGPSTNSNSHQNTTISDKNPENSKNPGVNASGVNSESSGGGGGSGGSGQTSPSANLPADINEAECGFYFQEYQICSGKCPSGNCILEGRSCYCRN